MDNNLQNKLLDLKKGSHIILMYKEISECIEAINKYIEAEIMKNNKVICVIEEENVDLIKKSLEDINIKQGQLKILIEDNIYDKELNINKMINLFKREANKALKEGFEGLSITGEISFVLNLKNSFKMIIDYEKKIDDELLNKFTINALCRYNINLFDNRLINKVIELHPYIIWKSNLYKNPYYITLESFTNDDILTTEIEETLNNMKAYQEEKENFLNIIQEEENKFEFMFNKIDDPLFVHGIIKNGFTNFEMVNQSACEHLNLTEKELLSMSPKDIDNNNFDKEYYIDKYNKLVNNKHVVFESEHVTKDGEVIPVENKSHLFDYQGETKVLTITRNISARKKKENMQKELLEEKSKFEFIFNEVEDALFVHGITENAYTKFIIVNKKACELLGYEKEELVNKKPIDIIDKQGLKELKEGNQREKLFAGERIRFIINMVKKDGEKVSVENKAHIFEYKGEKLVLTIARDISDRIKKENRLKEQYKKIKENNKELKISNNRLNKLVEVITKISKYSIETEDDFLIKVFRSAYNMIPDADFGSVYKYNDTVNFIDAIGHDIDKLNKVKINSNNFKKYKEVVKTKDIHKDLRKIISKEKYKRFVKATRPIKETLAFDIKVGENSIGGIGLDISEESDKEFDEISFSIFSAFKDIVESFYKIQNYNKLRGKFTKELALSLIHILEFHDEYTTGHSENVAILSSDFAEFLELDKNTISQIYWAGLVHDIGKIIIPSYILNKEGKLTKQEYEIIKNHPKWAYETLKRSKQLSNIAEYVLYHHERYDGKGYPEGIKGESIPLVSQILSICDSWDAMRTNRSYRDALTYNQAMDELKKNKGEQHSVELVNKFIKMLDSENDILFSHK